MLILEDGMGPAAQSFRNALHQARHPIALAGAGLSAASGIPTFRGAGGKTYSDLASRMGKTDAY